MRTLPRSLLSGTAGVVLATLALVGCGAGTTSGPETANPHASLNPKPDNTQDCAMSGLDQTPGCLQVALQAIDDARAKEHLGPMRLPAAFATLPFDQQMLAVVDAERVARRLAPVVGVDAHLDDVAAIGARTDDIAPDPGVSYPDDHTDADAGFSNALDIDFQWMYDDGPGSGTSGCDESGGAGCWADRRLVLSDPTTPGLVLGAAEDPTGDTQDDDKGGPSMAITIAGAPPGAPLTATWAVLQSAAARTALTPLQAPPLGVSATGIPDPAHTEPADPDYTQSCANAGIDDSPGCLAAILAAIDDARSKEGVKPMVLPPNFAAMDVPEQLFVTTNLERVDRGLRLFTGLSANLDANALTGAAHATDPPDPSGVIGDDEEWAGGAVNGLDADYGWMYDDGRGSANADCPRRGGVGCWGHREGILDDFGTVGTMAMGAAWTTTGPLPEAGFAGGTSMATTLVAQLNPPPSYLVTWDQALAGIT